MKKIMFFILAGFLSIGISYGQSYKKVKVTLKSGLITKGSKATLTEESVSFIQSGSQKTYALSDVLTVQAKEGKAGKYALYSGGGCLGIGVLVAVTQGGKYNEITGEPTDTGTLLLGSVLWAGIFAGAGALVGTLSDSYQNIYISKSSSMLKKFDFNLDSSPITRNNPTKYNFTLSYKF